MLPVDALDSGARAALPVLRRRVSVGTGALPVLGGLVTGTGSNTAFAIHAQGVPTIARKPVTCRREAVGAAILTTLKRLVGTAFRDAVLSVVAKIILASAGIAIFCRLETWVAGTLLGALIALHRDSVSVRAAPRHARFAVRTEKCAHTRTVARDERIVRETHTFLGFFVAR